MNITIVSVNNKLPAWVTAGYAEYKKRLIPHCKIKLIEIPLAKRTAHSSIEKVMQQEGEKMLAAIAPQDYVVALDVHGSQWSSEQLAQQLTQWQHQQYKLCFLIGGPDGLAASCKQRANQVWSLSLLTLPHAMVKIVLLEQLYRAWCIMHNHPYHRA